MNKYTVKIIIITNLLILTSCTKTGNGNDLNNTNTEEMRLSQETRDSDKQEVNIQNTSNDNLNIRVRNQSPFDIIIIKKDKFNENILLEKYNYYFADSKLTGDELQYLIDIDVYFPQISMPNDKNLEYRINDKLKIPLLLFGNNENERIKYFEDFSKDGIRNIETVYSSYEILFLSEEYLSINYTGDFIWGNGVSPINFMATIDLNTGTFLLLDEIFDFDSIVSAIERGEYELLEGAYNSGFGNGYEDDRKMMYIESLKNGIDSFKMNKEEFGLYSSNTFTTDGTYLYVYALDDDTLDGYFILKLRLDDITSKIDFHTESNILGRE